MSGALSVILALTLAAEPVAPVTPAVPPRVPHVGILITASLGIGMMGAGSGFVLHASSIGEPKSPPAPSFTAPADYFFVGGLSLIATGLCLVLIAALLTRWYTPKTVFGVQW